MMMWALLITIVYNVVVSGENIGYSHLELTANPGVIHPILTKTLQLRCSVKNNTIQAQETDALLHYVIAKVSQAVQLNGSREESEQSTIDSSNSQGKAEFSRLLTLVMTKRNKQTGLNETIASVIGCDTPVIESKYIGTVQVEGNTEGSTREGEQGFITLTWKSPLEKDTGEFHCEASALNSEKMLVALEASLEIQAVEPKISDLVNYISTNDKQIFDLKSKVSELYEENQYLKNKTTALANGDEAMKLKVDQIKTPKILSGSQTCGDKTVEFSTAFNSTPKVFTSFPYVQFYSGRLQLYKISVNSVTNNYFVVSCSVSGYISYGDFDWMAIGF